jgi:L-ribulose-5-phosphate 3-epimerase UlaE
MASYPQFTVYRQIQDVNDMYGEIVSWGNRLTSELELRDDEVRNQAAIRVEVVTTVTEIGRPQAGDVAFSSGESKFKGYTGSTWVDFH